MSAEAELRQVKRRHSARLLQIPGVSGVGIERDDRGKYVLAVHLDATADDTVSEVPPVIEGHPVKLVRSGPFKKFGV